MLQCFIFQSEEAVFGDMLAFAISHKTLGSNHFNPNSVLPELEKCIGWINIYLRNNKREAKPTLSAG